MNIRVNIIYEDGETVVDIENLFLGKICDYSFKFHWPFNEADPVLIIRRRN